MAGELRLAARCFDHGETGRSNVINHLPGERACRLAVRCLYFRILCDTRGEQSANGHLRGT